MPLIPGMLYEESAKRRNSGRFPWLKLPKWTPKEWLISMSLLLFVALTSGLIYLAVRPVSDAPSGAMTKPQTESAQPVPSVQENAPTAPIVKEWPKVEVIWSEPFLINSLADLPPSLPAGKGFYRETSDGIGSARGSDEAFAFAQKILPKLSNEAGVIAGIARDPIDPKVVFAAFSVISHDVESGYQTYLFLSIDGENTWYQISHIPAVRTNTYDIRVMREGEKVVLLVDDPNFVAPMWRKAILSLKSLP